MTLVKYSYNYTHLLSGCINSIRNVCKELKVINELDSELKMEVNSKGSK